MKPLKCQLGQALAETTLALPFVIAALTLLLAVAHRIGAYYLADYWSYQSALCLAQEQSERRCKKELTNRLKLIPFIYVHSITVDKKMFSVLSQFSYQITGTKITQNIKNQLRLPITANDFKGAQ